MISKEINAAIKEALYKDDSTAAEERVAVLKYIHANSTYWLAAQQKQIEDQAKEIERLETKHYVEMNNYRTSVQTWQEEHDRQIIKLQTQLNLAVKALEEISSGYEWNWESYVDIASDALSEINQGGNHE